MGAHRVHKSKGYTIMSNYHLRDEKLSLKAKGLLSVMFSLPEDWKYSIGGLVAICKESETSVKSALNELKENKYLVITKIAPSKETNGRYDYMYDFYEFPQTQEGKKQEVENLPLEILPVEILPVENDPLYKTTDTVITDNQIKIDKATDVEIEGVTKCNANKRTKFVKPTIEEIQAYINDNGYSVNAEKFYDYYEANGWYAGSRKMKDWMATVRNWERRDKERGVSKPVFNNAVSNNIGFFDEA